jgi:hypothetical protein
MKVLNTYIVKGIHGGNLLLLETTDNRYYLVRNGQLDRNDERLREITPDHAHRLINYCHENIH